RYLVYLLLLPLLLINLNLISPSTTFAQGSGSSSGALEVAPAYVDVSVKDPQEEQTFKLSYSNKSSLPMQLEFFPIDFRQTDPRGTIGFLGTESKTYSYSLSSFISFETDVLQLDPGETKSIDITIKNR